MIGELAQIVGVWPLAVSLAAVAAQGLFAGRRRTALNEALHELRRPLQALALTAPGGRSEPEAIEGSVRMAATALERLEREINGESPRSQRAPLLMRPLLDATIARWARRAELVGGSLALRWRAGEAMVVGDRDAIARALDNLVVNAIEHGGPSIAVEVRVRDGHLSLAVIDSGRVQEPEDEERSTRLAELLARLSGRRQRGHGLRLVRRTAAVHGGDFRLHSSDRQTEAVLELPLAGGAG